MTTIEVSHDSGCISLDHMEYPGAPYSASIPIGAVTSFSALAYLSGCTVPLDPVADRAWIKSNGLGVIAGEDLFQDAIKSYIEEARAQV
jgi:hypothetical protein